jgi:hypothetical protein
MRSSSLLQQLLQATFGAPNIARRTIRGQRFGARGRGPSLAVDEPRTASNCWATSAPPGCILLMDSRNSDERCFAPQGSDRCFRRTFPLRFRSNF